MEPISRTLGVDLRRFGVLRELGRRGSLARTAEALHLTPSAVSQQLATLSREVGVPLLERRGRGVRLTSQARVLLEHADLMVEQWERARADLARLEDGTRGAVTIGAFSSAITGLLPQALMDMRSNREGIDVAVVEGEPPDVFTLLDNGEIDVVTAVDFAATPPHTDRRYARSELMTDILDLALHSEHPCAMWEHIPLRELKDDSWIVGDPLSCCGAITRTLCASQGFTPSIVHAVNDWASVAALVEAGMGVALIPRLVQPLYRPGLVLRALTDPIPGRHVFAAVRAGSTTSPVLTAVLGHLQEAARHITEARSR